MLRKDSVFFNIIFTFLKILSYLRSIINTSKL